MAAVPNGKLKKSSRHKQYQPKFLNEESEGGSVPLPSVESFKLDYILNKALKNESQQVISQLTNVFANYQDDLRSELKSKLLIEQKIQYKNIQLGILINKLSNHVLQRRKKCKKLIETEESALTGSGGENLLGSELDRLLVATVSTSGILRDVTERVRTLTDLNSVSRQKYPSLYKLLNKDNLDTEMEEMQAQHSVNHTEHLTPPNGVTRLEDLMEREEITQLDAVGHSRQVNLESSQPKVAKTNLDNLPLRELHERLSKLQDQPPSDPDDLESESDQSAPELNSNDSNETYDLNEPVHITPLKVETSAPGPYVPDDMMTSEQFELFMSDSISKYREIQSNKYDEFDPFATPKKVANKKVTKLLPDLHFKNNPINLLYSSLLSNPNYMDTSPIVKPTLPFPGMISAKSPATTMSDHQISHFKKLRINGCPITSETFLKHPHDANACLCNDTGLQSPARRSLTETLLHSENFKLGSDDDTWNSSGINTDNELDDEDDIVNGDPNISSDSTDSDSLSSGDNNISVTNEFYSSFNQKLKQKKKKRQSLLLKQKRQQEAQMHFEAETSPTPKHKPSHHKLKPKRSILKASQRADKPKLRATLALPPLSQSPNLAQLPTLESFDSIYSNERTGISALNEAYEKPKHYEISSLTVPGTILSINQDDEDGSEYEDIMKDWNGRSSTPEDSIKSIFMLKSLMSDR